MGASQQNTTIGVKPAPRSGRFRLREAFALTALCAVYSTAVHWALRGSLLGVVATAAGGALIGVMLVRRGVTSVFVYGSVGGALGGAVGLAMAAAIAALTNDNAQALPPGPPLALVAAVRMGLLGGLLGVLFGVLIAIVLEEIIRSAGILARRRRERLRRKRKTAASRKGPSGTR